MLAVTVSVRLPSSPSLNGCLSASSRRSATSSGPACQRQLLGDHDELVAAEAPERVGMAHDALQPRRDGPQQLVADVVPERVVDALEVVEVDEQRRHRRLAARRAREHLLDAVEDQRPVRQSRQRVVRRQERELLLAARELLVGSLALGSKHSHTRRRLNSRLSCTMFSACDERCVRAAVQLDAALAQDVGHHVAPPEAAPGDLVEGRRPMCGELAEDLRGFARGLVGHLEALAGDPARDRDRRARCRSARSCPARARRRFAGLDRLARPSRLAPRARGPAAPRRARAAHPPAAPPASSAAMARGSSAIPAWSARASSQLYASAIGGPS